MSSTPHSSQCSSPAFPDSPEPVSVPATPLSSTFSTQTSSYGTPLSPLSNLQYDYPSPSLPYTSSSPAEKLAACPAASAAATRIVAAAAQITSIVQKPFLFMSDASMVYTLPACLRLIEHLHVVEILRDAEDERQRLLFELRIIAELHKSANSSSALAHPLRLLSTHHILRETAPDTFALTRVASLLDSGKSVADVFANPEKKYEDTTGIAAFVGMCTDELFKSAAYLTEAFTGVQLPLAPPGSPLPAFNLAFNTPVPFFECGREPGKSFRLERFSQAMIGTSGWEAPGAILTAFDWLSLPRGSTIVDVGGGIGSTTMILARAFGGSLKPRGSFCFIVQDRPVVIGLGLDAWRAQCPEMLESGQVTFYVYILRVVLHDWPDARARHVLLNLRLASSPETRLIIADHVLPLACWTLDSVLAHLEGAHGTLAPAPLLPNLGKASATPFSMDIVMHITFNGKERTLRELCALALSSGWRIARVTYSKGSHFGHLVCEPV
ncbi:S-adenosyl-L-methionine-dependent methyltransferase, partial [Suillus bovinus]|uniref:S-adenosyl-L-methionine-dependent methyltransferase n=1 Tax=Suillus bovinus TaxID=48563 RepID=UPI001B86DFAE